MSSEPSPLAPAVCVVRKLAAGKVCLLLGRSACCVRKETGLLVCSDGYEGHPTCAGPGLAATGEQSYELNTVCFITCFQEISSEEPRYLRGELL